MKRIVRKNYQYYSLANSYKSEKWRLEDEQQYSCARR